MRLGAHICVKRVLKDLWYPLGGPPAKTFMSDLLFGSDAQLQPFMLRSQLELATQA